MSSSQQYARSGRPLARRSGAQPKPRCPTCHGIIKATHRPRAPSRKLKAPPKPIPRERLEYDDDPVYDGRGGGGGGGGGGYDSYDDEGPPPPKKQPAAKRKKAAASSHEEEYWDEGGDDGGGGGDGGGWGGPEDMDQ